MWHVEGFDARGDPAELERFLADEFLPFFRAAGFEVRVSATRASLGPRQFWLATGTASFGSIDDWSEQAGPEGARLIATLLSRVERIQAAVVEEL
jgi:hypothetical protein